MKFSIAIPTRNRLEYLKAAVASVLSQDYADWEIIISDNNSSQDLEGYISSLKEPRIHYSKTETFISVTENWNRALDKTSGDYVILIGDDDCLMKGCFSILSDLIKKNKTPELIFSNGLLYIFPEVHSAFPNGHLITIGNWHLFDSTAPVIVNNKQAQELVRETMNFRLPFSYNMQVMTMHRSLIKRLKFKGKFFHSPYPDFYAITVLLYTAQTILWNPYPITVAGLSPKSFGGYHINNQEDLGMETLKTNQEISQYNELDCKILPGKKLNICWLYALHSAVQNLSNFEDLRINFNRFRRIQMVAFLEAIHDKPNASLELVKFSRLLHWWEFVVYGPILSGVVFIGRFFGQEKSQALIAKMTKVLGVHRTHINYEFKRQFHSISEISIEMDPYRCPDLFKR